MKKRIGLLVGGLGLGMLIMACGGSDSATGPGGGSLTEAALIGKWTATSVHTKGWEEDDSGGHKTIDSIDAHPTGSIEYKSDKSVTMTSDGFTISGTWSIKGDSIITVISIFGLSDTTEAYASISGNTGTYITHQVDPSEDLTITTIATRQ